ncbi:hypothetical protein SeMB42_g07637 [Synchytrium endobioticum]|uniref:Uncharacterized protein n=1 Tax=Synchytrium endobioticum TaxID=286115 RepID=A0A507BY00_9FUNG|nr:hypothetical protein SeMB42_g07637 [Synchytrium endobioticum]
MWSVLTSDTDTSPNLKVCWHFPRGDCRYNDRCKSFHGSPNVLQKCGLSRASGSSKAPVSSTSANTSTPSRPSASRTFGAGAAGSSSSSRFPAASPWPASRPSPNLGSPNRSPGRIHTHSYLRINTVQSFLQAHRADTVDPLALLQQLNRDRYKVLEKLTSDPPTDKQMIDFAACLSSPAWEWDPSFNELVNTLVEWKSFLNRINELLLRPVCTQGIDNFITVLDFLVVMSKKRADVAKQFGTETLGDLVQARLEDALYSEDIKSRLGRLWTQIKALMIDDNIRHSHLRRQLELQPDEEVARIDDIPILPDTKELFGQIRVKVPGNRTRWATLDAYRSAHYLMLREEYIGPLREVVLDLFSMGSTNGHQHYVLYSDVTIASAVFTSSLLFEISYQVANRRNVDFSRMNHLQYGSLVLLFPQEADSNFGRQRFAKDMVKHSLDKAVFATIGSFEMKKPREMPKVSLSFLPQEFIKVIPGTRYYMVESPAYFIAFEPVLTALRRPDVMTSNPLARLLVLFEQISNPTPKYITAKSALDVSSFYNKRTTKTMYQPSVDNPLPEGSMFDESQANAVHHALTHQVALIHGPPGTGKSFVGVHLARILSEVSDPVLIVTYTNHALDQFLDQISQLIGPDHLLRCGSNRKEKEEDESPLKARKIHNVARMDRTDYQDRQRVLDRIKVAVGTFTAVLQLLNDVSSENMRRQKVEELFWEMIPATSVKRSFLAPPKIFSAIFEIRDSPRKIVMEAYRAWLDGSEDRLVAGWMQEYLQLINDARNTQGPLRNHSISFQGNRYEVLGEEGGESEQDQDATASESGEEEEQLEGVPWDIDTITIDVEEDDEEVSGASGNTPNDISAGGQGSSVDDDDQTLNQPTLETPTSSSWTSQAPALIADEYNPLEDMSEEQIDRLLQSEYVSDKESADENAFIEVDHSRTNQKQSPPKCQLPADVTIALRQLVETFFMYPNVWHMNHSTRRAILRQFEDTLVELLKEKSFKIQTYIEDQGRSINAIKDRSRVRAVRQASIVGMTSTFAARNFSFVAAIKPKVAIIEEAGELLESQLLASVSSGNLEHLILIGDHLQLKPKLESMTLRKQKWDVSLFERLVKSDFVKTMLNTQQRMHPSIASLTKHFYDEPILDHPSVNDFPAIPAIAERVWFLTHCVPEDKIPHDAFLQSKSHELEAQFVVLLARFISQQGIPPSKITILSAYVQQVRNVRRLARETHQELTGMKASTVDNYQGDENDVIILSLVRSNEDDRAGFLKEENRAIVALSRARHALYIVGNPAMLEQHDAWNPVLSILRKRNQIGPELLVVCDKHPDRKTQLNLCSDFSNVRWGGCFEPCKVLLDCGHLCRMTCHAQAHQVTQCMEPCVRDRVCSHPCPALCGTCASATAAEPNFKTCQNKCRVLVERALPCGHRQRDACSFEGVPDCRTRVSETLPCTHVRRVECSSLARPYTCCVPVSVTLPCGHTINRKCSEVATPKCPKPCTQHYAECNHRCPKKCGDAHDHTRLDCPHHCDAALICSHQCQAGCGKPHTILCRKPCNTHCLHGSRCGRKCSDECTPCKERCGNGCSHRRCSMLCWEMCDVEPCNERCEKIKGCGHRCFGLCGELCPDCPFCSPALAQVEDLLSLETIGEICAEFRMTEDYNMQYRKRLWFYGKKGVRGIKLMRHHVQAENTLYVLPDCRHPFTTAFLDAHFNNEATSTSVKLPTCPSCRTPIYTALRYSHLIKRMLSMYGLVKVKQKQQLQELRKQREQERRMVVNAISAAENFHGYSNIGHWFYCPNGHPYFIGECGGAMQISRCPDCGAVVGGANHSLVAGNSFAPIDGASAPSWPGMARRDNP